MENQEEPDKIIGFEYEFRLGFYLMIHICLQHIMQIWHVLLHVIATIQGHSVRCIPVTDGYAKIYIAHHIPALNYYMIL